MQDRDRDASSSLRVSLSPETKPVGNGDTTLSTYRKRDAVVSRAILPFADEGPGYPCSRQTVI